MARRKVLVLTDGKAGHENQSRAFAGALGADALLVPVRFKSAFHKALSYPLDRAGIRTLALFDSFELPPVGEVAAVVGTGSGTFYAAKAAARRLGVKCGVVLYPRGYDLASFDCILAPSFDRPKKASNVIEIPANLVAADKPHYDEGVERFREHYERVNSRVWDESRPAEAVIVGGPNKCSTMTVEWMRGELDRIFESARSKPTAPAMWVTTSRRTPPDVESLVESYPWDYALIYSKDRFNPIPAFVARAKRLYVTAESTGMLSEACTSGGAVVTALDNLSPGPHKFRRFVEGLARDGYVNGSRKVDLSREFAAARSMMNM